MAVRKYPEGTHGGGLTHPAGYGTDDVPNPPYIYEAA